MSEKRKCKTSEVQKEKWKKVEGRKTDGIVSLSRGSHDAGGRGMYPLRALQCGYGRGANSFHTSHTGVVAEDGKGAKQEHHDFEESARLHIQGCIADGDTFPEYLAAGDYDICYDLDAAALIRNAGSYTTMSAISRASGINQKQLSHYANGVKRPRSAQLERIKSGLHIIGSQLLALC